MSIFANDVKDKIEHYLGRYETRRSAILPVLHVIQDHYGWIKPEHIEALEQEFDLAKVHVQEVATFYMAYRLEEPKPFRIECCDNIVCTMMGVKKLMAKVNDRIAAFEAAGKDCPFSMIGVPCLGVCDGAPAILVNKDRYLKVNEDNIDEILEKYAPLKP
jgi:NADH:ubiquinone oxidoreductase subunit E